MTTDRIPPEQSRKEFCDLIRQRVDEFQNGLYNYGELKELEDRVEIVFIRKGVGDV
jgi:hypothetical protein